MTGLAQNSTTVAGTHFVPVALNPKYLRLGATGYEPRSLGA